MKHNKKIDYKTFCYENQSNLLFFYYNSEHPVMVKTVKFEFGRVRIFTGQNKIYTCQLFSSPHLNLMLDWNQDYFIKLFKGLELFELEKSNDQHDDTVSLVVRDRQQEEQIYLMRAKLNEQFGHDCMNELWNTFSKFNNKKVQSIESNLRKNQSLREQADQDMNKLFQYQDSKEKQVEKLKGQLSALLREKQAKLKMFNDQFEYFTFSKESDPSMELGQSKSIGGSLFPESQQFGYQ